MDQKIENFYVLRLRKKFLSIKQVLYIPQLMCFMSICPEQNNFIQRPDTENGPVIIHFSFSLQAGNITYMGTKLFQFFSSFISHFIFPGGLRF